MAHNLQHLAMRNDHYIVPEVLGQGVGARGSSMLPNAPAYTQKRPVPQPPQVRGRRRSKSKPYFLCTASECNEKFSCIESLETHMKLHQVIKPFTCNVCGKVCRTERRLNVHQARHAGDGEKCKCDICERNFSSRSALKRHKLRIHRPLPHVCPYCHSGFEEHRHMVIHARRAHEKNPVTETSEDETSGVLSLTFDSSDYYTEQNEGGEEGKKHFETTYVTDEDVNSLAESAPASSPAFECRDEATLRVCDVSSTERMGQVVSPPITCEMCTSTFPSLSYLEQHMAVHIDKNPVTIVK